jgi:AAA domain/Topoisomerase DNA binding C4 zinc finger/PLD-like domain
MVELRRPHITSSTEDLETIFAAHPEDLLVLSQLVQELSLRKTKRARRLLALAAEKLAGLEPEADGPATASDDKLLSADEEGADAPEHEEAGVAARDDNINAGARERPTEDKVGGDQPPDDRKRPEHLARIRPVGTPRLPQPWVRPLNADRPLNVAADADLPQIYVAALTALIAEIKATGAGQKRYELENGVRAEGNEAVYEFPFADEADLFEDAKVEVEISGRRIQASIVSISSGRLWLATGEELGGVLQRVVLLVDAVVLLVDATALLEALKQRIEEAYKGEIGLNRVIADAVVGKAQPPADPISIPEAPSEGTLDRAQSNARRRALAASITYVWGPPGCGKTHVLSEIVRSGFEAGKRVLVCSNTNKAVDQVLFRICESLGKQHPAMENGRIVRLGTIADTKLAAAYNAYVTIDGIVERRSADLKSRLSQAQVNIARIDQQSAQARTILDQFVQLDNVQRNLDAQINATNALARTGSELNTAFKSTAVKLRELNDELLKRRNAVFGLFKRSEQTIQRNISTTQERRTKLQSEIENTKVRYSEAKERFESAKTRRDRLHKQLAGLDRSLAERIIDAADKSRAPFVAELREIESKISELRTSVMKEATVLGATCTKTYLGVKEIGQVDTVIIDEASMVLLPMAWFVAGLAKDRVIVCGDFRQIPPIVQTSQQAVFDVLGHDVFSEVKLDDPRADDARMVMLDTQYRMDKAICGLISEPMYGGLLKTAVDKGRSQAVQKPPPPYDGTLTIIDTSDLWPFESVNAFFSRFNLMHALLARNLAWHLHGHGYIKTANDLAICTPYAAQARLISKLLDGENLGSLVQVGTVHSFQGDERNAIVLELPEGHGGARMLGQFLQGVPPKQIGSRIINVAVSRAKNHLIVLANLTYLDRLLPSASLLRGILYDMQGNGRVVPGAELLKLRPIESDLRGLFDRVPLDMDAKTMGIFNQSTFDAAIESDLANSKESIVIFSGFVTPSRVAKLGDLLRLKTADGVKVRCVTRPPKLNGTMDPARSKNALDALERIRCVVDCRARIHEKVVLIDKEIVWHGSLNVLSHTHRTDESMTRVANAGLAKALAANMSKRRVSSEKALQTVGDAENPRCEACAARSVYNEGKFGPFFYCEDECGWSINLKRMARQGNSRATPGSDSNFPKQGPSCPICNGKTALRNGRNGPFYGCTKYPECKGTINPTQRSRRGRKRSEPRTVQPTHETS